MTKKWSGTRSGSGTKRAASKKARQSKFKVGEPSNVLDSVLVDPEFDEVSDEEVAGLVGHGRSEDYN